jgi:hypothetical protein
MAAGQVKTVSGSVSTYVITDVEGSTVTVAVTQSYGAGITMTFASSGGLHQDGAQLLTTLMQLLSTGLIP